MRFFVLTTLLLSLSLEVSKANSCYSDVGQEIEVFISDGINSSTEATVSPQVESNCQTNFPGIGALYSEALQQGRECLSLMGLNAPQNSKIHEILRRMSQTSDRKMNLICSEENYSWDSGGTRAHASSSNVSGSAYPFPYISIFPELTTVSPAPRGKSFTSTSELRSTLFHEYIHTLGYQHGMDFEVAYGCESCCFGAGKEKQFGCKLCAGNYPSKDDVGYLKDLVDWAQEAKLEPIAHNTIRDALTRGGDARKIGLLLMLSFPGKYEYLVEGFVRAYPDTKSDEKWAIDFIREVRPEVEDFVSEVFSQFYFKRDTKAALKVLSTANFSKFYTPDETQSPAEQEKAKRIHQNTRKILKAELERMWLELSAKGDASASDQIYELRRNWGLQ